MPRPQVIPRDPQADAEWWLAKLRGLLGSEDGETWLARERKRMAQDAEHQPPPG